MVVVVAVMVLIITITVLSTIVGMLEDNKAVRCNKVL